MSHPTSSRRGPVVPVPVPSSLECPLASLGRNTSVAAYHHPHPLSSSPLDPQDYQMAGKSPVLSISDNEPDLMYNSPPPNGILDGPTASATCNETHTEPPICAAGMLMVPNGGPPATTNRSLTDMYQLSHSSSQSSLDQPPPLPVQHKAATFELRGARHGHHDALGASSSASMGRQPMHQQRSNLLAFEHLLQYGRHERNPQLAGPYIRHGHTADTEDSSDAAPGVTNGRGSGTSRMHQQRHQQSGVAVAGSGAGGRCSVPLTVGQNVSTMSHFLEKKMDALYLGNAMRGLPRANHFQNEHFYLEDGLRNLCDYQNGNERLPPEPHLAHNRASSPSETSGSDRYLLNRTSSPANGFSSSTHLDNFSSSNNNTSSSNHQRFHHAKVKSLSDGLCHLGRFSPSLDQGYATLVSSSPTASHHPNTITTHSIVHHPPSATMTAATRRHHGPVGGDTVPPPWSKKGPFRSGPYFDRLPDEAIVKVFSWLNCSDSSELCQVARVCRRFEQLSWRPVLWKVITLKGEHLNGDKTLKMIFRQLCGHSSNGSCPEVERVMLADGCRISDKGLQLLTRRCPELTHLQLQNCVNVSNQALMDVLTKCTNLQHLDVTGCTQVSSISPNLNLEPPRRLLLQYLDLTDCMAIDDIGLKIVVKCCPQLVYLYLRRCIQITDAGLKFVPSFCIALKELSVSDCVNITDFGLYELAKLGAALRYLSVAKCDRVSDAGLKVIARRCYKLRYLNARGCEAVSDDSITVLARSCPRLRALDIGKCDVSDAGLRALAESCPNLKKLSLRNCDMITDRGVQCIAYYCRGLQQLNIQDCQISIEGYRAVKKYCKRCIIEHTNPGFC